MAETPDQAQPDLIATPLAAHVPPLECDHKAALELLYQQNIRDFGEPDFEALVRHYREARRQDAAKALAREIKRREKADAKAKRKTKSDES